MTCWCIFNTLYFAFRVLHMLIMRSADTSLNIWLQLTHITKKTLWDFQFTLYLKCCWKFRHSEHTNWVFQRNTNYQIITYLVCVSSVTHNIYIRLVGRLYEQDQTENVSFSWRIRRIENIWNTISHTWKVVLGKHQSMWS